jgi:hypothetical protein
MQVYIAFELFIIILILGGIYEVLKKLTKL